MKSLHNLVFGDVNDCFGLPALVRNVELVKRCGVGTAVRLLFGPEFFNYLHLA